MFNSIRMVLLAIYDKSKEMFFKGEHDFSEYESSDEVSRYAEEEAMFI